MSVHVTGFAGRIASGTVDGSRGASEFGLTWLASFARAGTPPFVVYPILVEAACSRS